MSQRTAMGSTAPAGLEGVIVSATTIGDVNGAKGFYHYRGYNAVELAATLSYEEVWYLLHRGSLPTSTQLAEFCSETAALRVLPEAVQRALPLLGADSSVPLLSQLRSALSITGAALGWQPWLGTSEDVRSKQALQAVAVTPLLIASLVRGEEVCAGSDDLGIVGDFLTRLGGSATSEQTRALEQYLITTIDHGFNASTFAARVVTSTGADLGAALTAAIGALSGPLHGGAPSLALTMLEEIGTASRAEAWVQQKLDSGERIMGFGHRVYRGPDPRADFLREVATKHGSPRAQLALEVEEVILARLAAHRPDRVLATNVEYWAAVVMESVGLSPELFTPAFTMSRMVGWTAHIAEQTQANKLIRPSSQYVGPSAPRDLPSGQ